MMTPETTKQGAQGPTRVIVAALCMVLFTISGCASGPGTSGSQSPLVTLSDPDARVGTRIDAAGRAWDRVEAGAADRLQTREALKTIAWAVAASVPLRTASIDALRRDRTVDGINDTKRVMGLMLMRERHLGMVDYLSTSAADEGWVSLTTAIVRSYARPLALVAFNERAEGEALRRLHPGVPLPEVVFDVVLNPIVEEGPYGVRFDERARADAWELLSLIDSSGAMRSRLISGRDAEAAAAGGVDMIVNMRAALDHLMAIPTTAEEIFWLARLRDPAKRINADWWGRARRAIATLGGEQRLGLDMRHAEPIRWTAANKSEWLTASRVELIGIARARLEGRERHRRSLFGTTDGTKHTERLRDAIEQMVWADVLTLLVVDEAIHSGGIAASLGGQSELDRADRTTEYGGVLEATELAPQPFRAACYPPRARMRLGDSRFVASEDMIEASDRALAHYHLQVQKTSQKSAAGPSGGDFAYAARSGRTCVVFTSVGKGVLNADYYQPNGVVVDLGELRFTPSDAD